MEDKVLYGRLKDWRDFLDSFESEEPKEALNLLHLALLLYQGKLQFIGNIDTDMHRRS